MKFLRKSRQANVLSKLVCRITHNFSLACERHRPDTLSFQFSVPNMRRDCFMTGSNWCHRTIWNNWKSWLPGMIIKSGVFNLPIDACQKVVWLSEFSLLKT